MDIEIEGVNLTGIGQPYGEVWFWSALLDDNNHEKWVQETAVLQPSEKQLKEMIVDGDFLKHPTEDIYMERGKQ